VTSGASAASADLQFASLAAENAATFFGDLIAYLSHVMRRAIRLFDEPNWQVREQHLILGQAHLSVVCGLQYVRSRERGDKPGIELLAAPVMCGRRYRLQPV
jgi:hypothetical protein